MISEIEIHIVSFTIPYPPDYGGVIDVFYKIKALYELGVKINLHCFQYDRKKSAELNKFCKSVHYYQRPKKIRHFFSKTPFIVLTRSSKELLGNLKKDSLPILFEGLHTTYFLRELAKNDREIIVRMHNIEHKYYSNLAKKEKNIFNKVYYACEGLKLKYFQKTLKSNIKIAAITQKDCNYFSKINTNSFLIEAFHPNEKVEILEGKGNYILFHGNLSVHENIEAAKYILINVCPHIDLKFIIAGKDPDNELYILANKAGNAEIIGNPDDSRMTDLIQNAQLNLLITFQRTGIKLKLINALFRGRHCIVNPQMVNGTGFEELCHIAQSNKEIIQKTTELKNVDFTLKDINNREETLLKNVNNKHGAQKLINLLDKN